MFKKFKRPSEIIEELRNNNYKGIYVVRAKNRNIFKDVNENLHNEFMERQKPISTYENKKYLVDDNVIYIGKGYGNGKLLGRLQQEFLQTNKATFFRSIGAVLLIEPYRGQLNPINYMFQNPEKQVIIDFIEKNYEVSCTSEDDLNKLFCESTIEEIEKCMIKANEPIFNIQNNPNKSPEVEFQRACCRNIASQ